MTPELRATFRKPFPEQVASFRARLGNLVPTTAWDDIERNAHDQAFMVAGATKADLLADLGAAVDRAISEGSGIEAFRRDFDAITERHGWHGWTGDGTKAGRAWRTKVIYATNMRVSMAAGRYAQLKDGKFPFWVYRHSGAENPRLDHLSWDGLVLEADHPFWAQHYPPNDWGCGCYVRGTRSKARAPNVGGKPGKTLPDGWDKIDPKTGAPAGLGKGWDYAPGSTMAQTIKVMSAKTVNWPYEIAKAYMDDLPDPTLNDFVRAYRAQPSLETATRRFVTRVLDHDTKDAQQISRDIGRNVLTWGRLSSEHVQDLARAKVQADGFDFSADVESILHIAARHMGGRDPRYPNDRPVTVADIARLPALLEGARVSPAQTRKLDNQTGVSTFAYRLNVDGEIWNAVFQRRRRRRMLALVTLYIQEKR